MQFSGRGQAEKSRVGGVAELWKAEELGNCRIDLHHSTKIPSYMH